MLTACGVSVTVAAPGLVPITAVVAETVTVCGEAILAGGAYKPEAEIEPVFGEIDQMTGKLGAPVTVAANCCGAELTVKEAESGEIDTLSAG